MASQGQSMAQRLHPVQISRSTRDRPLKLKSDLTIVIQSTGQTDEQISQPVHMSESTTAFGFFRFIADLFIVVNFFIIKQKAPLH